MSRRSEALHAGWSRHSRHIYGAGRWISSPWRLAAGMSVSKSGSGPGLGRVRAVAFPPTPLEEVLDSRRSWITKARAGVVVDDGQVAAGVVAGRLDLKERAEHPERFPSFFRVTVACRAVVMLLSSSFLQIPPTDRAAALGQAVPQRAEVVTGSPASKLASAPSLSRRLVP